jgi:hypothetical protein
LVEFSEIVVPLPAEDFGVYKSEKQQEELRIAKKADGFRRKDPLCLRDVVF